jgi:AraC family L-rhamnose operon regulatory protein RhaS
MRLIETFIFLSRCYESYVNKPLAALPTDAEVIAKIGDFIRLHYDKPLTLLQVSQLCGMSQSTFTARFKQHTGRTFIEFRNDIRLQEAKRLLADGADKIIAIAHKVGFDDLSFFNRLFKQQEGVSPGQFRSRMRNTPT